MPPSGDGEEGERNTYANHQRDERRVEFMIHRHDACPDHWAHRRLEYGHAEHLLLRAQHTCEEEENHCRTDDQLEHKSDDQRLHLAPYVAELQLVADRFAPFGAMAGQRGTSLRSLCTRVTD